MAHSSWGDKEAPPLGERPDFKKLDQERAERNAALEYTPIDRYPQLVTAYQAIGQGINRMREAVDSPAVAFPNEAMRLLDASQWSQLQKGSLAHDAGALYDSSTGNMYMQFDADTYASSRLNQIISAYTIAHESGHKATHGIGQYSFHLSEGAADYLAQQVLENGGLASFMTDEELARRDPYLAQAPVEHDGFELSAKDIFIGPDGHGAVYTRIPQLRMMEIIQSRLPAPTFNAFLKGVFEGDGPGVKQMLQDQVGGPFADALDDRAGLQDPRTLESLLWLS